MALNYRVKDEVSHLNFTGGRDIMQYWEQLRYQGAMKRLSIDGIPSIAQHTHKHKRTHVHYRFPRAIKIGT